MLEDKKPQPEPTAAQPPTSSTPSEEDSLDAGAANQSQGAPAAKTAPGAPSGPASPPPKKGLPGRFLFNNLYLVVFAALVLAAGIVVYVSIKTGQPPSSNTKVGSLTDQQVSTLKGNTTLVGDSKNTLDVQSNSIFEGQV